MSQETLQQNLGIDKRRLSPESQKLNFWPIRALRLILRWPPHGRVTRRSYLCQGHYAGQRERIGASIYEAGHHTPFQHPTFVFGLQNISRHVVWSFFHSHPYYNSEQQSQRYVVMDHAAVFVPPLEGEALTLYEGAVLKSWSAYNKISQLLVGDNFQLMEKIGKLKGQNEKSIMTDSEKKAIENARYVLPLGAFTTMYHTISGIVLKRYVRMARLSDCPYEAKMIVDMMVEEVRKIDPDFIERIGDEAFQKML